MKVPFRTLASFGVNKGYVSDAAYLVDYPSPSDGDFYYNTTDHSYHYYNSSIPGFVSGSTTSIGSEVGGATPYTFLYTDGNGNLGNNTNFALSKDYIRLLLGGANDDGVSDQLINGNLSFEAGVIAALPQPSTTTITRTGQVIINPGQTGLTDGTAGYTVTFTSGPDNGNSYPATYYAGPVISSILGPGFFVLTSTVASQPNPGDTYAITGPGITGSLSSSYGADANSNFYFTMSLTSQPATWVSGLAVTGTFINGTNIASSSTFIFYSFGGVFTAFVGIPRSISPYPFGTSDLISEYPVASIDPVNRILIANDGISNNLDWSNPGRVLVNSAPDDTVSALQVNGQTSLGGNVISPTDATYYWGYNNGGTLTGRLQYAYLSDYIVVGNSTMITDYVGNETLIDGISTFGSDDDVVVCLGSWNTLIAPPNNPQGFIGFHTRAGAAFTFGGAFGFYQDPTAGNRSIHLGVFNNPSHTNLINIDVDGSITFLAAAPNPVISWADGTGSLGAPGARPAAVYASSFVSTANLMFSGAISGHRTPTATSYTILNTDFIVEVTDNTAQRTMTLPDATTCNDSQIVIVKDKAGTASSQNNILFATTASQSVDGIVNATGISISANYGVIRFYTDKVNWYSF